MRGPLTSISAMLALALSLGVAQAGTAQVRSSGKKDYFKRTTAALRSYAGIKNQKSFSEVIAPSTLEPRPSVPSLAVTGQPSNSYRSTVNLKLLLPQSQLSSGVAGKEQEIQAHLRSSDFAPPEANNRSDDPEYFARHVPVVGGLMAHVLQESKAHPRVTRVFQVIRPEF